MPDIRRRLRSYDDASDTEEAEVMTGIPPRKKQRCYDPFSQELTPLALRCTRRK